MLGNSLKRTFLFTQFRLSCNYVMLIDKTIKSLKPWYWRSLPLKNRTGSEIFAALFIDESIATLLESPNTIDSAKSDFTRYSICAGSPRIVEGKPRLWTPATGEILPFLRSLL